METGRRLFQLISEAYVLNQSVSNKINYPGFAIDVIEGNQILE